MVIDPRFTKEVSGFVYVYKDNEIPTQISGDSLTLTLCDRTDVASKLGNYFVSLNLPPRKNDFPEISSLSVFHPELLQLNVDKIILYKIPNTSYTEYIDGRSIELNVPVTGYSTSTLKLFSSTFSGTKYALKEGETSPLLGDNIAYLFCDEINVPYSGLTIDDSGIITDHSLVRSWYPDSRNYAERPSAVSYLEVAQSNDTINTDRRYEMNKTVFTDGLFPDYRGIGLSFYGIRKDTYTIFTPAPVAGNGFGLFVDPKQNYFQVGDPVTLERFDKNNIYNALSGNCFVAEINKYTGTNLFFSEFPDPNYGGPWDVVVVTPFAPVSLPFTGGVDLPGYIFTSGGTYYNYDIPVGFVVLDKGLVVITHKDIVNNIPWTQGRIQGNLINTANTTTNIYFTGATTNFYGDFEPVSSLKFTSLDTVFQLRATCNCLLGEFFISNNGTWIKNTVDNPLAEDDPVAITEIGLYNELNELIAVAKFSEPVLKGASDLLTFEVDINL